MIKQIPLSRQLDRAWHLSDDYQNVFPSIIQGLNSWNVFPSVC